MEGDYKVVANEVAIGLTMPRTALEITRNRLAPAHFTRAMMTSEIYKPADAVAAGFLDKVVSAPELMNEAQAAAARFGKLNMVAFKGTRMLARESMLKALKAAMEADHQSFRTLYKLS